jgi:cytochrome c oxidase assembly factor CtaG
MARFAMLILALVSFLAVGYDFYELTSSTQPIDKEVYKLHMFIVGCIGMLSTLFHAYTK